MIGLVILQVHILQMSPVVLSPTSVGRDSLDEHCMRDRDWIPVESIHYLFVICKYFYGNFLVMMGIFMCILYRALTRERDGRLKKAFDVYID